LVVCSLKIKKFDKIKSMREIVLSGMRPTGLLHLGNLVGALNNWKELQDKYTCFFMIADYHGLTTDYLDIKNINSNITDMLIDWLACGISQEKAVIFRQSAIPEHAQLHLLLSVITPLPLLLQENPTYKEQIKELKHKQINTYGFLGYPVLQAADILLYKATIVPVGKDQLPHLEIARKLAKRFNSLYGEIFPIPQPYITEESCKLPGLDSRKMSKSYDNCIYLTETEDSIRKKVEQMITDPSRKTKKDPGNPKNCKVVYHYHKIFNKENIDKVEKECKSAGWGCRDCKYQLQERLIDYLRPIQAKRKELEKKKELLQEIIHTGNIKAKEVAEKTFSQVKEALNMAS
jgi:tryptophanyl-tRNA synthetase